LRGQGFVDDGIGPRRSLWRHHACAKFPDNFLPDFGVLFHVGGIEFIERKIRRVQSFVVAGHAVLIESCTRRLWRNPSILALNECCAG